MSFTHTGVCASMRHFIIDKMLYLPLCLWICSVVGFFLNVKCMLFYFMALNKQPSKYPPTGITPVTRNHSQIYLENFTIQITRFCVEELKK